MRERYKNGKLIEIISLPYEIIPDDYKIQSIITHGFIDFHYAGILKALSDKYKNVDFKKESKYALGIEFTNKDFYVEEMMSHLASDYLNSALLLAKAVLNDRKQEERICSSYVIPCAFCCKHAIELKLKYCLFIQGVDDIKSHNILKLWESVKKTYIPNIDSIENFLKEVNKIDPNEMTLRYNISNKLTPLSEKLQFDVVMMIQNTMFLFNILEEYVIYKCRNR